MTVCSCKVTIGEKMILLLLNAELKSILLLAWFEFKLSAQESIVNLLSMWFRCDFDVLCSNVKRFVKIAAVVIVGVCFLSA